MRSPWQFPIQRGGLRKARFRRFPYSLIYRVLANKVEIVACFHAKRHPRHWQRRQ
jgi:toxin ParE1/3/4